MNVVISGTSSGIGLALARKFLQEGHSVFGFDKAPGVLDSPSYCHFIHDVCSEQLPCDATSLSPDILINNAGTQDDQDAIKVNLEGAICFTELFLNAPSLKSILFIASASARNGSEFPRYVASKAGLVGYMKNIALNYASRGITCNSISPGGVITPSNQHILESEELYSAVKAETLLGKWATPEEIADLAYFVTVVNKSMTGEDILVDNGEMLKSNFIW